MSNRYGYNFYEIDKEHAIPGTVVWLHPCASRWAGHPGLIVETDIDPGYGTFRLLVLVSGELEWYLSYHVRYAVRSDKPAGIIDKERI